MVSIAMLLQWVRRGETRAAPRQARTTGPNLAWAEQEYRRQVQIRQVEQEQDRLRRTLPRIGPRF